MNEQILLCNFAICFSVIPGLISRDEPARVQHLTRLGNILTSIFSLPGVPVYNYQVSRRGEDPNQRLCDESRPVFIAIKA